MTMRWRELYGQYFPAQGQFLNLGCAENEISGSNWMNLDMNPLVHKDINAVFRCWNLEQMPLPFEDHTFDTILASHVLEHVRGIFPLMRDLWRVLKPGGYLIAVTPHGSGDDAWDNPHHVRGFSDVTAHYFTDRLYRAQGTAGTGATQGEQFGNWVVVQSALVPFPKFLRPIPWWKFWEPDLDFKVRHYRNVIQEVHMIMRAI